MNPEYKHLENNMHLQAPVSTGQMQHFDSGATRSASEGKPDYEGFLSPHVIEAFGEYMHTHRKQADGKLRDSDNWQKGMPLASYMKSMWRHFFQVWKIHRNEGKPIFVKEGDSLVQVTRLEALMALLFNVMGYAHELLKAEKRDKNFGEYMKPTKPDPKLEELNKHLQEIAQREKTKQEQEKWQKDNQWVPPTLPWPGPWPLPYVKPQTPGWMPPYVGDPVPSWPPATTPGWPTTTPIITCNNESPAEKYR